MASNEQQWDITSRSKQQIRQNKRRERAQRMLMQAQQQRECADSSVGSPGGILHSNSHGLNSSGFPNSRVPAFSNNSCQESNDDDDSEASHHQEDNQTKRPVKFQMTKSGSSPTSCKLVGEPLYEEDVIDGFAIVSFTSYEDLEAAVRIADKTSCLPDPLVPLDTKERIRPSPSKRSRKSSGRSNGTIKNRSSLESSTSQQPSVSNVNGPGAHVNEKLEAAIDSGSRDSRGTSIDRFSDVSRHSNSSRGYLCDSESEENDKNINNQELRGHSPTTAGSIRPVGEFVAPVKQRPFSPAHAGLNPNTSQCSSSSNAAGENGGNNLRWVGFSGSPRPATAVAPHGHFQNGPRLPDCQPTEGGAGPSPAPPAAPSPRLTPHPPIAGSLLNSFPLSSPSSNSAPIIRNEFNLHPVPFSAPSSSPSSLSSSGPPPLSYIAPPFYSSTGQRPPSTDGKPSGGSEGQRRTPTLPSVLSHKLPPPPGPQVKPPSPFLSVATPATGNLRPSFSMAAPLSAAISPQSTLVPPSPGPPPPVFTSSSYPFFPPVSMMRTSTSSSSHSAASFLAPSPPTSGLPQPRHSSLGPPPPLTFGDQPFALTNRTPYSTTASTTFPPTSTKLSTPSSERSASSASELNSSGSRPASRASGSEPITRTGSLPFPGHLTSRRSPSLPGPPPSLATFPSPMSSWPRPPAPDPIANRQFCPSPKTSSSPAVRSTSGGRQSPPKEPLSLVSVKSIPVSSSSSIPQMSSESYSDMLRQELNSRFLNSTPGMSSILPPHPTPGVNKMLDSSSLYRPMMPPLGHGLPGLGPNPYPAPPLPSHSSAYGLTSTAPQLTVSSSTGQPISTGGGGIMSNLSALGLPTASSNNPSLPSKSKPGKWNAMHVRIAWEIYQNQQRQVRDPHSDPKRALNLNLTPKLSGPATNQPGLPPSVPPLPPVKLPGSFADPLPSPHNSHNNPYGFSHHNVAGFLPRMPSVPNQQQHSTTPPSHPSLQPHSTGIRSSPAAEQWNRLPASSPAPWLAPLMNVGPMPPMKVETPGSSSSSAAAAAAHHHQHQQQAQKERDRQRKEEREREKERERERAKEKERERNERQEREREKKREEEREKRRHASRSPLHHSRPTTNGAPSKNELSSSSKSSASNISSGSSLSGALPPLPTFHPGMQMTSAAMVERSRLGLPPLSSAGLYGQPYDPYLRMDHLSIEREQREFLSRFGASASHLAGLSAPSLYGHGPSPSSADRYPYGLGVGLPPDRYRDAGLPLPPHLSHHLAGSLGLSLAGQQSGVSLNDRYGPIPGMSGAALYPPTSTGYPFPPLGPSSLLGSGMGPGMGSLPILPPSMLSSSGSGKRSPPPPSPAPSSNSLPGGPLSNPSALASLGRSHMGMLPPGMGLSPYPMPSPSPMLNQHLLPSLGSSLSGGARSGSSATPPVVGGRPMLDLTSPHQQPPGPAPFNPLDPFPRKDDPQSR